MSEAGKKWLVPGVIALGLLLVAWLYPHGFLPSFAIVLSLTVAADHVRRRLFPTVHAVLAAALSIVALLAAQSILQTLFYYADARLGSATDLVSLAIAIISVEAFFGLETKLVRRAGGDGEEGFPEHAKKGIVWMVLSVVPALVASAFVLRGASHAATVDAIRTPWPLLPAGTLAALAVMTGCVFLAAWRTRSRAVTCALAMLTLLTILLIAPLVYRLGFGFDGFLHRASEQLMLTTGTLSPKPAYYIGQYVFVTWMARLFQAPLGIIDLLLVPVGALLIPLFLLIAFPETRRSRLAFAALVALMPLAPFVATTPQAFAYLLGLAAVLSAMAVQEERASMLVPLLLAGWSLATHPLAGLPFLGAILGLWWVAHRERQGHGIFSSPVTWILMLGTVVSVPLAFFASSLVSHTTIAWDFSRLGDLKTYASAAGNALAPPRTHVALWADWASFVEFLSLPLLFLLALVAAFGAATRRSRWIWLTLLGVGMVGAGFFLQTSGDFTFLIDYERGNYADRLYLVAALFLLPAALEAAGTLFERATQKPLTNSAVMLLFLMAWTSGSAYLALPRHDASIVGHGWSVSQADFASVRWIDQNADGKPYTVLADQSVSAAAVATFGFKRYVTDPANGEQVFYYPIPTGGPLYAVFLRAAGDEPTREAVQEAATIGQTGLVYLVLDDYWWNADDVADKLAAVADQTYAVEGGKTRVYRFDFTSDTKRSP